MSDLRTNRLSCGESWIRRSGDALSTAKVRLRYELRAIAGGYPGLFLPLKRWKRGLNGQDASGIINPQTALLIAGFPRSGNTFVDAAFKSAQKRQVLTAHHLHVVAQVMYAVKPAISTLVIVRQPKETIVALKLMEPKLGLKQILRGYVRYHKAILPYLVRCVVATFGQVTSDLGAVIARINRKYCTSFEEFRHTEENVANVFALLRSIGYTRNPGRHFVTTIPDRPIQFEEERERLKAEYDRLSDTSKFRAADQLYERIASYAFD